MLALQASIGALNDALDASLDAGRKPGKPIPRGLATSREALAVATAALVLGLGLSAPSGLPTVLVAAAGVACGYAYDLGLGRTVLSWLPLVVALPLLPVHAWLGATGTLPPGLLTLVPAAVLAGAALAIANAIVDVERDLAGDRRTIVVRLGAWPAWLLHAGLLVTLGLVAVGLAPAGDRLPVIGGFTLRDAGIGSGLVLLAAGATVLRDPRASVRERGWELEAIGVAGLGIGWLAGAGAAG
jgi:4-hydroxybenzoate polyprenyltransferase